MPRTSPAITPGTDPATAADTSADELAQDTLQAGALAAAATSEAQDIKATNDTLQAELAKRDAEIAELRRMFASLARNQAVASAEPVELPELSSVIKQAPVSPVLTKQGWYVPPVLPNAPLVVR